MAKTKVNAVGKKDLKKSLPGLSILLSVILISVIVVFSIGVTTMVTDSSRQAANVKQGTTAYYNAEAGLEQALWVNKTLAGQAQGSVGANTSGTSTGGSYKIQGLANTSLVAATVNGKYIQPFPWTGNVPWHGDGSNPVIGGCNPQKPPVTTSGTFKYKGVSPDPDALDHPCNWGKLGVGEKVSIPLFGVASGGSIVNIDDIKIKVRGPCPDGKEFCAPEERLQLNCFDKGSGEKKCVPTSNPQSSNNYLRGEVVMLWQIKANKADGAIITLNPWESALTNRYNPEDSQFYEGKFNIQEKTAKTFELLNTKTSPFPIGGAYSLPAGKNLETGAPQLVKDFIAANIKPTLTLSAVSSLVGCSDPSNCTSATDDPKYIGGTYNGPHMLPYLEYQVELLNASASAPPASKDNIVSAEGQAGPFNQTIQVKVPTDNSTLEYVIQQ